MQLFAQSEKNAKETIEIRIDPGSANADDPADVFSSVTFLPLQTVKESEFGQISQLEVTSKHYIIWDEISNCILFFDKKGVFISKISKKGKTVQSSYETIDHFTVDEQNNQLMFNDRNTDYFHYYTLNGKFIKKIKKPEPFGIQYIIRQNFEAYFEGYDYGYLRKSKKDPHNFVIKKSTGQIDYYLPFDTTVLDNSDILSPRQGFYNNQNGIINCSTSYNYNIFSVDSLGNSWNSYHFVLPALLTVPDNFLSSAEFNGKRTDYSLDKNESIICITDFYQLGPDIVFKLDQFSAKEVYTYNLATGNLRQLSKMKPDKTTWMLPPLGNRIYAVDTDQNLISSINAVPLFLFQSTLKTDKTWNNSLPESLKKFFLSDNQQNPVLTILSLKR